MVNRASLALWVRSWEGYGMHSRDSNLRRLARERIDLGQLPMLCAGAVHEGPGTGEPCALCGAPVVFEEVACELSVVSHPGTFNFHPACHTVWVIESIASPPALTGRVALYNVSQPTGADFFPQR
jgi:hypothetical protein